MSRAPRRLLVSGALAAWAAACAPAATPVGHFSGVGAFGPEGRWLYMAGGATSTASADILQDAWRFDTHSASWEPLGALPEPMLRGTASLHDGALYVFGGSTTAWDDHARLYRWDLAADTWTELSDTTDVADGSAPAGRFKHAAAVVELAATAGGDGGPVLLIHGGRNNDGAEEQVFDELWAWDLDDGGWSALSTSGGPGEAHRHVLAADPDAGLVWLHGGFQADASGELVRSDELWSWSLGDGSWAPHTDGGDTPPVRASHLAAATPSGLVVWGGNASDTRPWVRFPSSGTWASAISDEQPLARDAMVWDLSPDGSTLWIAGGDPVSEEVPDFVMDVWKLDVDTLGFTEVVPIR